MLRRIFPSGLLVAFLALSGCTESEPTDTGYVGTWSRGGERSRSSLAILERDGDYLVRWSAGSADGTWKVTCDWAGSCKEIRKGELVATYNFSASYDTEEKRLVVAVQGKDLVREVDLNYVDELRVRRQGQRLVARMVSSDGQTVEGDRPPRRTFTKVSDDVVDPPRRSDGA